MNISKVLEKLAKDTKSVVYDCIGTKYVEVSMIESKDGGQSFSGNREVYFLDKDDNIQIVINEQKDVFMLDPENDKIVARTISNRGANKFLNSVKLKELKDFSDMDRKNVDGHLYYVVKNFSVDKFDIKDSNAEIISTKRYRSPEEGIFGEVVVDRILEPYIIIENDLATDIKDKKQSYDLKNGSNASVSTIKNRLVKDKITNKDDLFKEVSRLYDGVSDSKQYFVDNKYMLQDNYIADLDIITLARLYIDLKTLEKS